jgi:hypothetical protein
MNVEANSPESLVPRLNGKGKWVTLFVAGFISLSQEPALYNQTPISTTPPSPFAPVAAPIVYRIVFR